MWENVIGIVNEQAGTNTGVEALINAPTHGGGRKRSAAARAAAAEAVMATGVHTRSSPAQQSQHSWLLFRNVAACGTAKPRGCLQPGQQVPSPTCS